MNESLSPEKINLIFFDKKKIAVGDTKRITELIGFTPELSIQFSNNQYKENFNKYLTFMESIETCDLLIFMWPDLKLLDDILYLVKPYCKIILFITITTSTLNDIDLYSTIHFKNLELTVKIV